MSLKRLLIIFLVLQLPAAIGLGIAESIEYLDSDNALISLEVMDIDNDSLRLAWSLSQIREEALDGNATLSIIREEDLTKMLIEGIRESKLLIRLTASLPLESGLRRSFPIPILPSEPGTAIDVDVLLPRGWTSQESEPDCPRILDRDTGRIQLTWRGLVESPSATPVKPGLGEDQVMKIMFHMALRVWGPVAMALIAPALIVAFYVKSRSAGARKR